MFLLTLMAIFVTSIIPIDSVQHPCSTHLDSNIQLVDKSYIEFGCKFDKTEKKVVSEISFKNSENSSQTCSFTFDHTEIHKKDHDCFFGERISFIGNVTERRYRFKIKPVKIQGKSFFNWNFLFHIQTKIFLLKMFS